MIQTQTGTLMPGLDALKSQAKRLRALMADKNTPMTHAMALEAVARQWGFRDWNTLIAKAKSNAPIVWMVGQRVNGTYLGHAFTGTLKAVRAAQGGFWHLTVVFDTPVDVVQSDAFSNYRKQVNVTLTSAGVTPAKTSDGQPHMMLHPA